MSVVKNRSTPEGREFWDHIESISDQMKKPYDDYINMVLTEIANGNDRSLPTLRRILIDAWLSGLSYSLNLIEGEKEKRNVQKD